MSTPISGGDGHDWIFLPWDQVDWPDSRPLILMVLGLAAAFVGLYCFQQWWKKRRTRLTELARVNRLCKKRHLNREETASLAEALLQCHLGYPGLALVSRIYFDHFLAGFIADRHGNSVCEALREKLFGGFGKLPFHRIPLFPDTRAIRYGESIRLHFKGFPGQYASLVVSNQGDGFFVVLPHAKENRLPLQPHDFVEGVFESDNSQIGFETELLDINRDALPLCKLAHTDRIGEIHHRESMRVEIEKLIGFHLLRPDFVLSGGANPPMEGLLADMTLGGCQIRTAAEHDFKAGELLRFEVSFGNGSSFHLAGEIISVEHESGGGHRLHAKFLNLNDAMRHDLAIALYNLQLRPAQRKK